MSETDSQSETETIQWICSTFGVQGEGPSELFVISSSGTSDSVGIEEKREIGEECGDNVDLP